MSDNKQQLFCRQPNEDFKPDERKPQLHASALGMTCMEAFRRRYIENEIIPPGIAIIVGTGTHKSIDANMSHKMEHGSLMPADAVQDAARDGVEAAWESGGGITLSPDEAAKGISTVKGEAKDKAVRLARLHHLEKAPHISPIAVERPWSLAIPGSPFELVGRLDIQEKDVVRDTKTSGKSPQPDMAARSVQLKAYALAVKVLDGAAPLKVVLDYLVDNKTPKAVSLEYTPDDRDFRALMARVETIDKAMRTGVFMPVEPTHWCCSETWCGYHATCRYVS